MKIRNRLFDASGAGGGSLDSNSVWDPTKVSAYMQDVLAKLKTCREGYEQLTEELNGKIQNESFDKAAYAGDIESFWREWNSVTAFFDDFHAYIKEVDGKVSQVAANMAAAQQKMSSELGGGSDQANG